MNLRVTCNNSRGMTLLEVVLGLGVVAVVVSALLGLVDMVNAQERSTNLKLEFTQMVSATRLMLSDPDLCTGLLSQLPSGDTQDIATPLNFGPNSILQLGVQKGNLIPSKVQLQKLGETSAGSGRFAAYLNLEATKAPDVRILGAGSFTASMPFFMEVNAANKISRCYGDISTSEASTDSCSALRGTWVNGACQLDFSCPAGSYLAGFNPDNTAKCEVASDTSASVVQQDQMTAGLPNCDVPFVARGYNTVGFGPGAVLGVTCTTKSTATPTPSLLPPPPPPPPPPPVDPATQCLGSKITPSRSPASVTRFNTGAIVTGSNSITCSDNTRSVNVVFRCTMGTWSLDQSSDAPKVIEDVAGNSFFVKPPTCGLECPAAVNPRGMPVGNMCLKQAVEVGDMNPVTHHRDLPSPDGRNIFAPNSLVLCVDPSAWDYTRTANVNFQCINGLFRPIIVEAP